MLLQVVYAVKAKGAPLGLEALPNRAFWEEAYGLALDGMGWTKAQIASKMGGSGDVSESLVSGDGNTDTDVPTGVSTVLDVGDGGSSGDEVIE